MMHLLSYVLHSEAVASFFLTVRAAAEDISTVAGIFVLVHGNEIHGVCATSMCHARRKTTNSARELSSEQTTIQLCSSRISSSECQTYSIQCSPK